MDELMTLPRQISGYSTLKTTTRPFFTLMVFALSGLTMTGGMTLASGAISSTVVVSSSSAEEIAAE
jgi:hypothetical protein